MRITFLGTSSGTPTRGRNVTSIALQLPQSSTLWLFDCGEGTQHQVLRSPLRLSQLERIFVTHLHGDHCFGLPGLLASRSMGVGAATPVTLYGPQGLGAFVRNALKYSETKLNYPIHIQTLEPGIVWEDANYSVECLPLRHRIPAYGYRVTERDQLGSFDLARAQALGIPFGPLYGQLKSGATLTLADGRIVDGKDFVGPPQIGRKVVYCSDTMYSPQSVYLATGANVLIHESTYLAADLDLAERGMHSTATMAAQVAQKAGVEQLILTHFSPRYEAEDRAGLALMLAEAKAIFPNVLLAHDFFVYEVARAVMV